jgi:hypothetical protein
MPLKVMLAKLGLKKSPEEKREHSRVSGDFVVKYKVRNIENNFSYADCENISSQGILIREKQRRLPLAIQVDMELSMYKREKPLAISGVVFHCRKCPKKRVFKCGIKFIDLDYEKRLLLAEFLKQLP